MRHYTSFGIRATILPMEMTPRNSPPESGLRELVLSARSGDREAAYTVLGEQVPTETWVAVINALAREPQGVDLEIVAHRTLRRPSASIPEAVLALAGAAGTAQAAFLARAIAILRSEEKVVSDAVALNKELRAGSNPLELLADERPIDALYGLLASPLGEQAALLIELGDDAARLDLFDALRTEYERLQEIAKDSRWRSGSYRHLLRHSLADLALIGQVGGKLEDQAYRLLQQRTDEPEANRELLAFLPSDTRQAYLAWVVERPAGKEETARALFALHEIEHRYPDDVDLGRIARLLESRDLAIAVAAAGVVARASGASNAYDRAVAELISRAPPSERAAIVTEIVTDVPNRIRLDLWPEEADQLIAEVQSPAVMSELVRVFETAVEADVRLRALALLGEAVDDDLGLRVAVAALQRSTDPHANEVAAMLSEPLLRAGLWSALPSAAGTPQALLEELVNHDEAIGAAERLVVLFGTHGALDAVVEDVALAGIVAGTVATEPLRGSQLEAVLEGRARSELAGLERQLERLRELVSHGDRAAEVELQRDVEAIVTRAIERSTGNDRLIADYRRLGDATGESEVMPSSGLDAEEVERSGASLMKAGVKVAIAGDAVTVTIDSNLTPVNQLRALAIADQRVDHAAQDARATAIAIRSALASALADSGIAEHALRDLAEGGALATPVAALSPTARAALFDAVRDTGFDLPASWSQQPLIGHWISVSTAGPGTVPGRTNSSGSLALLQATAADVRAMEARLEESRGVTRRAFITDAEPVLADLEQTFDAYIQVLLGLERLGIGRIAASGQVILSRDVDSLLHEIVGNERGEQYVVRFGGIRLGKEVVRRARLEVYS